MKLPRIIFIAAIVSLLFACGGTDEPATSTAAPASPDKAEKSSPHSIGGMKKIMDDAKGVETMLQQNQDRRQKEMDSYR